MSFARANDVCQFIDEFCGITLLPWQRKFIRAVYETDAKGRRKRTRAALSCGRKGGKTALAAALVLAHLCGPERRFNPAGSQLVSAAGGSREQARMVYESIVSMVAGNELLSKILKVTKETVSHLETLTYYKPLSTSPRSMQGLRPVFWIFDELAQARDNDLYSTLDLAQGFCEEPLGIVISTNSHRGVDPLGVLVEGVRNAKAAGQAKHWHLAIYEPSDKDAALEKPFLLKWVRQANPSYGTVLSPDFVKQQREMARTQPVYLNQYLTYVLNMGAQEADSLIDMAEWRACADETLTLDELEGLPCYVGVDVSQSRALTSVAYWFPNEVADWSAGGAMLTDNWIPADSVDDLSTRHHAPYRAWLQSNDIRVCGGRTVDVRAVAERIREVAEVAEVREIRRDDYRAAELEEALDEAGVDAPVVSVKQGYVGLGNATATFDRFIAEKRLRHDANAATTMCVANTKAMVSTGTTTPMTKPGRVRADLPNDATVAMIEAVIQPEKPEPLPKGHIVNWNDPAFADLVAQL